MTDFSVHITLFHEHVEYCGLSYGRVTNLQLVANMIPVQIISRLFACLYH